MDPWAEADWLERFRRLAAGKTAIIVTHRFTTAIYADVIHVMDEGKIITFEPMNPRDRRVVHLALAKFPGVDTILGPEMKSTGEVMGVGETFGEAYGKAMTAAGLSLPQSGRAFISVNDADKGQAVVLARKLARVGLEIVATLGTAERLREVGLSVESVFKVNEGRPNIVDHIKRGEIALVINTPLGRASHFDEQAIRRAALQYNVPCVTTMTGAQAVIDVVIVVSDVVRQRGEAPLRLELADGLGQAVGD